jgi:hypothetical protein
LSPPTQSQHTEDEFSPEQLVGIGAVVLAYNRAEYAVDLLLSLGLGLSPELASVVPSRTGRLEDKIEIVELAAKTLGLPREAQTFLSESLVEEPGLSILKRYRDAIARASEPNDERGKQKTVVLFKAASLEACVKHLEVLTDELRCLVNIFDLARRSISRPTDNDKQALAAAIRDELSRAQQCRNYRLVGLRSLPRLPGSSSDDRSFGLTEKSSWSRESSWRKRAFRSRLNRRIGAGIFGKVP